MKLFGLIGYPLSHSFSREYFLAKFKSENIAATYKLFSISDVFQFPQLIEQNLELAGLNVTIPYKETVIPFLDSLSKEAREIGAVNTIQFINGKLIGNNTDIAGFEHTLEMLDFGNRKALVFGNGGASKAVQYVFKEKNIPFLIVNRTKSVGVLTYEELSKELFKTHTILVNCTPVGTFPNILECLPIPFSEISKNHIAIDLVYNPETTQFLAKASEQGAKTVNGLPMLHRQAQKAWELWQA